MAMNSFSVGLCLWSMLVAVGAGCVPAAPYRLSRLPDGFVEIENPTGHTEILAKSGDDVGLALLVFSNQRGGTLSFWAVDLVKKLEARGYQLVEDHPVESANGVAGKRFRFSYQSPRGGPPQFYSVLLFAGSSGRVVVQTGGDLEHEATHRGDLDEVAAELVLGWCQGRRACF